MLDDVMANKRLSACVHRDSSLAYIPYSSLSHRTSTLYARLIVRAVSPFEQRLFNSLVSRYRCGGRCRVR